MKRLLLSLAVVGLHSGLVPGRTGAQYTPAPAFDPCFGADGPYSTSSPAVFAIEDYDGDVIFAGQFLLVGEADEAKNIAVFNSSSGAWSELVS